jgi:putative salt-induced outer membrane protein
LVIYTLGEISVHKFCALAILFWLATSAFADQVTLKNGDRLTGSVVKSDGKTVVLKTDYAGDVTVKFDAIQDITTTGDLTVGLSGGRTVVGPVSTSGENIIVTTKTAGPVEAPRSSVSVLRSPAEQVAYEKSLHPGLMEGWTGGVNVGFALTRGNSATRNLNIAFQSARKGFHDKLSLYTNSVYATNDLAGATPPVTANAIGGGARYDHDFDNHRVFGFVSGDFYHDTLQSLDLRSLVGGGLGWHTIKSDRTTLDLLAGGNYTHESYSIPINPPDPAKTRSQGGLTFGDDFMHKLGKNTVFTQNWYFFPNLSETGEYRTTMNLSFVTKLNKWLGWQNSFNDIYVSNPPTTKKGNDVLLSTGLNFSFTH